MTTETLQSSTGQPARNVSPGLLALTIAAIVTTLLLTVNPAPNNDLFWQLRAGADILRTHQAPHIDTYSWTRAGTPWVAHEWLSFVLMALAYRGAGFFGVYLLMAVVLTATLTGLFLLIRRSIDGNRPQSQNAQLDYQNRAINDVAAFVLWICALMICRAFFQPRPQIFTYLFMVAAMWLILDARKQSTESERRLWLLIPLCILWANLHAGVLIGVGVLAAFTVLDGVELFTNRKDSLPSREGAGEGREADRRRLKLFAIVTLWAAGTTLLTPYTYTVYQDFTATISNNTMVSMLGEWASTDFHAPFGHCIEIYLAVALCSMFFTHRRRRLADIVILLILVHQALGAYRNAPLLAIIGTPLIAPHATSALENIKLKSNVAAFALAILSIALAVVYAVKTVHASIIPPGPLPARVALTTIDYDGYPAKACEFIERERIPAGMRMYNIYGQGGFLIWRLPDHPVFIDGRADIYFGQHLDDVSRMQGLPYDWRSTLDKNGVDLIVSSAADPQARLFLGAPDWALVYADSPLLKDAFDPAGPVDSLIFIRRSPAYSDMIAQCRRDCPTLAELTNLREYPATW